MVWRILLIVCLWIPIPAAHAQSVRLQTVQQSGDAVPGTTGGTVTRAGPPRLSRSGAMAFPIEYEGGTCPTGRRCYALIVTRHGASVAAAATGQEISGTDARMTGHADGIALNDAGAVAFAATYYGPDCLPPGNTCSMALLRTDAGTSVIARQGRLAPGSDGGVFSMELRSTALNDRGDLVFAGSYRQGKCALSGSCGGVYRVTGGGAPEPAAVWGQNVAGLTSARYFDVKAPSLNESGEIAVLAAYTGDCESGETLCLGILVVAPAGRAVALQDGEAPGTGGGRYLGGKGSFGFGAPALNDRGTVAFAAEFKGGICPAATCVGVFAADATAARALVRVGQPAPGTAGGVFEQLCDSVALNNSGEAVFRAAFGGGNCAARRCLGVFAATASGVLSAVAVHGQAIPDAAAETIDGLGEPAIDDHGEIAFAATSLSGRSLILLATPMR